MSIAAVPKYLGQDFSDAPPGHRFNLYLPVWDIDPRTGDWQVPDAGKASAFRQCVKLTPSDQERLKSLTARQAALAEPLESSGSLLRFEARSVAPFTTGLGNEHPLENGFAFLNPYGLPYLAGSGVKGVLRKAARELAAGTWGAPRGWERAFIEPLFGTQPSDDDSAHRRGALSFWDVVPLIAGESLALEVMTPHQTHYYQQNENPHESGNPNPIIFLAVPPGTAFTFHVQCDRPFLQRITPALAEGERWKSLVMAALEHAFEWIGFGAKTSIGYGAMIEDPEAGKRRKQQAEQARLAGLTPGQRFFEAHAERMKASYLQKPGSLGRQQDAYRKLEDAIRDALSSDKGWTDEDRRLLAKELERISSGPTPLLERSSPLMAKIKKHIAALMGPSSSPT
jgi:CRISPR-associated protein Cmr6